LILVQYKRQEDKIDKIVVKALWADVVAESRQRRHRDRLELLSGRCNAADGSRVRSSKQIATMYVN